MEMRRSLAGTQMFSRNARRPRQPAMLSAMNPARASIIEDGSGTVRALGAAALYTSFALGPSMAPLKLLAAVGRQAELVLQLDGVGDGNAGGDQRPELIRFLGG
jgi:hypothetical protein